MSSSDHSDRELEDKEEDEEEEEEEEVEEEEDGEDREDHIYQSLDRRDTCSLTEPVYAVPLKPKVGFYSKILSSCEFLTTMIIVLISETKLLLLKADKKHSSHQ